MVVDIGLVSKTPESSCISLDSILEVHNGNSQNVSKPYQYETFELRVQCPRRNLHSRDLNRSLIANWAIAR